METKCGHYAKGDNKMTEPKAYTEEEIRAKVLRRVWGLIEYWGDLANKTQMQRLEGLAFSILSMLDGSYVTLPRFKVVADPCPEDKQYCIDRGEKWFPEGVDIAGCLHDTLCDYRTVMDSDAPPAPAALTTEQCIKLIEVCANWNPIHGTELDDRLALIGMAIKRLTALPSGKVA